jgi:DNA-binding response OmpR family regulator
VDGRLGIRKTACNLLAALGFECQAVASSIAGLRAVRAESGSVDIVICEHALPQTDAMPFVEELRQQGFTGLIFVHASQLDLHERNQWGRCNVDRLVIGPGALADILQELETLALQNRAAVLQVRQLVTKPAATSASITAVV